MAPVDGGGDRRFPEPGAAGRRREGLGRLPAGDVDEQEIRVRRERLVQRRLDIAGLGPQEVPRFLPRRDEGPGLVGWHHERVDGYHRFGHLHPSLFRPFLWPQRVSLGIQRDRDRGGKAGCPKTPSATVRTRIMTMAMKISPSTTDASDTRLAMAPGDDLVSEPVRRTVGKERPGDDDHRPEDRAGRSGPADRRAGLRAAVDAHQPSARRRPVRQAVRRARPRAPRPGSRH